MNPNDPYQGASAPQGNPYEFILNPEQKKRSPFRGGRNKLVIALVLIVGGVAVFMILAVILLNAFAPKKIGKAEYLGLAQTQNELIRIADQGSRSARQQVTKNLATTMQYTMMTQQKRTLQPLGKIGKKQLALKQKATTDQQFARAKQTSTFDTVFAKVTEDELNAYAGELKGLVDKAATDKDRDLMSDFYRQTQLLIAQIPFTQDGIEAAGQ